MEHLVSGQNWVSCNANSYLMYINRHVIRTYILLCILYVQNKYDSEGGREGVSQPILFQWYKHADQTTVHIVPIIHAHRLDKHNKVSKNPTLSIWPLLLFGFILHIIISGNYWPQFTWKVGQTWNLAFRKSYLIILAPVQIKGWPI